MTVAGANSGAAANGSGQAGTSGTRSLSIRGLNKEYVRGKPVLRGISLDFAGSGFTAIIGPSGTGKSTLIRCINRLVEPSAGQIGRAHV